MYFDAEFPAWWALTALTASVVAASHWWYRRRLAVLLAQMARLDRARHNADQMAQQARRQIEQLQKDLAAQLSARTEVLIQARKRPQPRPADVAATLSEGDAAFASRLPANGFADTEPMQR